MGIQISQLFKNNTRHEKKKIQDQIYNVLYLKITILHQNEMFGSTDCKLKPDKLHSCR